MSFLENEKTWVFLGDIDNIQKGKKKGKESGLESGRGILKKKKSGRGILKKEKKIILSFYSSLGGTVGKKK